MPKSPPDLARLLPSPDPADRVQVQQTDFGHDVLGRYVCNDWGEIEASLADGGYPFDAVVIGAGMFGAYCAEKLYRDGENLNLRILVLEAGAFLLPSHVQNLPQRLGGNVGGPAYARTRDDASRTQNVVWGMPWISNEPFPGLAYCVGGRSLFWGGWSPRLTSDDLANWPAGLGVYLLGSPPGPGVYDRVEKEIGVKPVADFMMPAPFHDTLLSDLQTAAATVSGLDAAVEEAPLAVQGSAPGSGIFPFDKFSSAPWIMDAIRDDAATNAQLGDASRRIFLVPRTQVLRLAVSGGAVSAIEVRTNGQARTLPVSGRCAVVIAAGTIESTRLALESLGIGSTRFGSPRLGNLMAHLRSNIVVRVRRAALGLPAAPKDFETTAFLVRGTAQGRRFHLQVVAAATGSENPEKNLFEQVPDVEIQDRIRANQDPTWVALVFRGIGEMEGELTPDPDPARSWIDLSPETDQFGMRRAYVHLVKTALDTSRWRDMDAAAFGLAAALAGGSGNIEYWNGRAWQAAPPAVDPQTGGFWRDSLGSTHHEAGTLFCGAAGASVTDVDGRFHGISNAYVAGPALFPTLGSANPSLTALSLARRTAGAIVAAATLSPPGLGFSPLSFAPADWAMVAAPGTGPSMTRHGPVLETAGGYGLYFYVKEQFANFALWVEWRERHRGDNSGVYLRTPGPAAADALNQADLQGHEIQIDDSGAPDGAGIHLTGAVYGLQAPTAVPVRPLGEWNTYLIQANGGDITVTLNGQVVNAYRSTRQPAGYLALQAHHFPSRVQFRNPQVKKLP